MDLLIRDVPDDVIAALDAHARRLGLSRSEYVRRRLAQDAVRPGPPVSAAGPAGQIDRGGRCDTCGRPVAAADTVIAPGPELEPPADGDSWVTGALTRPHRLLEPLRAAGASAVP